MVMTHIHMQKVKVKGQLVKKYSRNKWKYEGDSTTSCANEVSYKMSGALC